MAAPILRKSTIDLLDVLAYDSTMTLQATCYYPHKLKAIKSKRGQTHKGRDGTLKIYHMNGWDRVGYSVFYVSPTQQYLAEVEGSAILDLSDVWGLDAQLPITYYSRRWHVHPEAPYGLGSYGNPLVPGRDFAHKISGGWPLGTRIELQDIPAELEGRVRQSMYRGGSFGKETAEDRVDLFVASKCTYYGPISATVEKPWQGVSRDPVKGCQEALMILGYHLPRYGADGSMGLETQAALDMWAEAEGVDIEAPGRIHPTDPEVAYWVREIAKCQARKPKK